MSVDQLSNRPAQPLPGGARLVQYDAYIDRQVESTRRVVKLVDLATSLVVLAAGVLAYLLLVAVVEHWLVPAGFPFAIRLALFMLLVCGVTYYAVRRLLPVMLRRINPVYAAQAIEQAGPSLKNSLINLLLFRQKRSAIPDAVYKTLEEQAAQRLSRVPVDAAVDRTLLIRFGYVLLAVVAIACFYKAFSPKDPIVAARRVLMPWAEIVPASRVSIRNIEPGEVTLSRGEHLPISAEVRGMSDADAVVVKYTTRDGQAVDKPVTMRLSADGLRYEGRLPEGGQADEAGLAESLTYRIEAGDARSLDYAAHVLPTPSILVEKVDYDYPEYTGYLGRSVEGLGDIRAIEGTRITIHARANGPIAEAHVDFDADGRRELPMTARETNASASFVLELRGDRQTPKHASYVLRFMNRERRPNVKPVKHSIVVDPDYSPEVEIVAPREDVLDVRLDEALTIEVGAHDPDFALADVRLHGEVAGRQAMDERLLKSEPVRRYSTRYKFTPNEHSLRAGDTVHYWISVSDTRTPSPNTTNSKKKVFRIVSPDPAQQPPPDRLAQRDPQRQRPGEQRGQRDERNQPRGDQGQQGRQGEQGQSQDGAGSAQRDGNQPGESRDEARSENSGEGEGESGRGGDARESPAEQRESQDGRGSADEQSGESGEQNQRKQNGDQAAREGQGGERRPGASNSNDQQKGEQTGAGAAGGEPSNGAQPDGARRPENPGARATRPDGNQGESSANRTSSDSGAQPPENAEPSAVSSQGDDDAEAFNRIQKHLARDGQLNENESPSESEQGGGREAQRNAEQKQEGEREREGEAENTSSRDSEQAKPGDEPPSSRSAEAGEGSRSQTQNDTKSDDQGDQSGTPSTTKGEPGAGHEKDSQGAPNSQPQMKPGEKRQQQSSQGEQSNEQEPPAGARGKKESDSQGEEGGDRAGGGEEGGGQQAPREGTGSSGQNQAADDGAGESGELGQGNQSSSAGRDSVADNQKGTPGGETTGRGRKQLPGEGDEPGGEQRVDRGEGEGESGRGGEEEMPPQGQDQPVARDAERGAESGKQPNETTNQGGTATGEGGQQGSDSVRPPQSSGKAPEGDEANLEYARKQTDLVLEKLSDQLKRQRVDDELLKQLGWSEDDLRKFIERWQARKQAAQQRDEAGDVARRELDDALRSLGLRRGALQQNRVQDDQMRDLREGYRGTVPLEYQERLRAYNQGVSRAQQDRE
jgi:hypothetical protein